MDINEMAATASVLSTLISAHSTPSFFVAFSSFPLSGNNHRTGGITIRRQLPCLRLGTPATNGGARVLACLPSPSSSASLPQTPKTRLYISGLSFRTTEESLRNAFENYGQLVEVNLVMDKIANRPRGFAFLRYATEEESQKAIEGMHGKSNISSSFLPCAFKLFDPLKKFPWPTSIFLVASSMMKRIYMLSKHHRICLPRTN
ncbi:organelle RRM domain-containing protein 6, chloroplastic isoform X1 [Hevea brasiliensis]|uniref:organelle RRM domain-containing protein 6, chloroplastic isoform X1 n=1 Tax=Hevea brasiliensis TaxID=3981 RepID=UPI0025E0C469|nr:organelle RRM domain-containing protein 6, chloroplastic isoform X1 [Hevea brasiliensis]